MVPVTSMAVSVGSSDRAHSVQSAVVPRVIPIYLFLHHPTGGIAEEGSNKLEQRQMELRKWPSCAMSENHYDETAFLAALCGSSLRVFCSFRFSIRKEMLSHRAVKCLLVQLVNPMLLFQNGAGLSWGAAGTAWNFVSCSSLVHKCCDHFQRSQLDAYLVHISLAMALVLQGNVESSGFMRAGSEKGLCQPIQITPRLFFHTKASPCVQMDKVHNSSQPSKCQTMPHLASS